MVVAAENNTKAITGHVLTMLLDFIQPWPSSKLVTY